MRAGRFGLRADARDDGAAILTEIAMTDEWESREELSALRERGDELDRELVALLERRAELARQVHQSLEGTGQPPLSLDETLWLERLAAPARHLPPASLRAILREVRGALRAIEEPSRVAFVGALGGLGDQMVRQHFGASTPTLECATIGEALEAVARGRAVYAVFPIETSEEGITQSSVTALAQSELVMVGERTLAAAFDLVGPRGGGGSEAPERLFVTAPALVSCERLIRGYFASAEIVEVTSPLDALRRVREEPSSAALVPSGALGLEGAEVAAGLSVLEANVGDLAEAFVRFGIAASRPAKRAERNTTCLVFGVQDRPGALFEVLRHFAERGLNLGKVQSRPLSQARVFGGPGWDYVFYVEVEGHETDRPMVTALEHVKRSAKFLRVLGSYPSEPPRARP